MKQMDMNEENEETKRGHDCYQKHGPTRNIAFIDWLEAKKPPGEWPGLHHSVDLKFTHLIIWGIAFIIMAFLLIPQSGKNSGMELPPQHPSRVRVILLVLDLNDMQAEMKNSQANICIAGYTVVQGAEDMNQKLGERSTDAVRDYLNEKGIAPERIALLRLGRRKSAVYEETPVGIKSKEANTDIPVPF